MSSKGMRSMDVGIWIWHEYREVNRNRVCTREKCYNTITHIGIVAGKEQEKS